MKIPLRVLLAEDSDDDAALVLRTIKNSDYEVTCDRVDTASAMEKALLENKWDIIISDYRMPQFDAIQALSILRKADLDIPFLIVSGTIGEDTAVAAMRAGAHDYIMKNNLPRLLPAIERELRDTKNRSMLRQKEEQLILSQKLEGIGRLASGIAHDFNNHLAVIIMSADVVLDDPSVSTTIKNEIAEIKIAAERSSELTKQLLAFCRKQVLRPKVIQLNTIISDMNRMFLRLIPEDIKLQTHLEPTLKNVKADPAQLQQVVMNLVVNARDAMPSGGQLTIETRNFYIDEPYLHDQVMVKPGPYAVIVVNDTGTGMDPKTLAHIFEPFFTTKTESKGTGLGLAVTYGIVKQSGGYIWVTSEQGKGTNFEVYLPTIDEDEKELPIQQPLETTTKRSETILLVEDKDSVRRLIRKILESNGHTVLEASSGPDAIKLSSTYKNVIHMLVTDVIMPEMKGQEVADHLRTLRPNMKVLYISGYADDTFTRFGISDPGPIFLSKPFTQESLLRKVSEILDSATIKK